MTDVESDWARAQAVVDLEVARDEQERLAARYEIAKGTGSEFAGYVRLRGASRDVSAKQRRVDRLTTEG